MKRKSTAGILILLQLGLTLAMGACATLPAPHKASAKHQTALSQAKARQITQRVALENTAAAPILNTAMKRVEQGLVLLGSCFDFVEAVYSEAGFRKANRKTIYAARQTGPYASAGLLQPGDWIYYDHNYRIGADHSCIFVAWLDLENRIALTIDYPGANRAVPGRFQVDALVKVWGITRLKT